MRDEPPETHARRKDEHLDLVLHGDVSAHGRSAGFERLHFEHDALPELDLDAVDPATTLLGQRLAAPLLVGAMTGGTPRAAALNEVLAEAAAAVGVGMAFGSQRGLLANPERLPLYVTRARPVLRIGNLGAVQLVYGVDADAVRRIIDATGVNAFAFHLNPLQEAIQPEGQTRFAGVLRALARVVPALPVPVVVKEVGAGISPAVARRLASTGVAAVEVAGVGGTSWASVEGQRSPAGSARGRAGATFRDFGIPTAECLERCRREAPGVTLLASGGVRTGLDGAKAIALGAAAFAVSRPLLAAAEQGLDAAVLALRTLIEELRIAMFCTASATLAELARRPLHRDPR